jgi:hypothetical protein
MVKTRKQQLRDAKLARSQECAEGPFGITGPIVMHGLNPVYIDRTVRGRGTRKLEVSYTGDTDIYDKLDIQNAIDIPESELHKFIEETDELSEDLSQTMLHTLLPQALAFDQASAYVETAARDGLNTSITIDDDVLGGLAPLSRLSIIYRYLKRLRLPKRVKERILFKLVDLSVEDMNKSMNTRVNTRKYSQQLRDLTGIVRSKQKDQSKDEPVRTDKAFLRKRSPTRRST